MPPFGPLPRVWYVVGALAACVLLSNGWLAWRQHRANERVVTIREQIRAVDTLYRVQMDTVVERRTAWRTARDTLLAHDTTLIVREATAACDSALSADSVALAIAGRRVALRDTLAREIVNAVSPKPLQFYGEALTGYQWKDPELRAGVTLRLTKRVQVVGEVAHRLDDGKTFGRVGVRLTY